MLASGLDQVGQSTPDYSGQPTLIVCPDAVSESPPLSVPAADGSSQCVIEDPSCLPYPGWSYGGYLGKKYMVLYNAHYNSAGVGTNHIGVRFGQTLLLTGFTGTF